jgi:hypothetical protein
MDSSLKIGKEHPYSLPGTVMAALTPFLILFVSF